MSYYVPGTEEKDPKKVIMSLMQAHSNIAALLAAGYVVGPGSATDNALVRFDATTGKLVQNSDITLGDSDGKLTRTAGISLSGTNTNDSAASGYVGEYTSSTVLVGSAVSLTTSTVTNVTSFSLGAGDWDVTAAVVFNPAATTNTTFIFGSISETSATHDVNPGRFFIDRYGASGLVPANPIGGSTMGPVRKSFTGSTTLYLTASSDFTVSTMSVYGIIRARRVR